MADDARMRRDFDAYRRFRRRTDIEDRRKEWFGEQVAFGGWAYVLERTGGSLWRKPDLDDPAVSRPAIPPTSRLSRALGSDDLDRLMQARENIDRHASAGSGSQKLGTVDATIDFTNMPSWIKNAVNADGAFKNLKVTRSHSQAGKAGSGVSDYNTWSYE